jgi:putative polyketide hydroxylase
MLSKPTLNSAEEHQAFDANAILSPFEDLSPEPAGHY